MSKKRPVDEVYYELKPTSTELSTSMNSISADGTVVSNSDLDTISSSDPSAPTSTGYDAADALNNNSQQSSKKVKIDPDQVIPTSTDSSSMTVMTSAATVQQNGNGSTGSGSPPPTVNNGNNGDISTPVGPVQPQRDHTIPASPSKVVHIRNIPNEANETDLMNLGLPFGKITNIMLLKGKNQAFIEFAELNSAQCMVNYWVLNSVHTQPTVRGRHVFCQFSNHQQLKPNPNFQQNAGHQPHLGGHHDAGHLHNGTNGHSSPANNNAQPGETSVVRVVVDQLLYPMTLDTFYQLFSRYGKVHKIVTFTKNNSLQALVQFDGPYSAQSAKQNLDGQAIFGGNSNILRVDYSKLPNLNVKYNNDKSRDYTNPLLPPGNAPASAQYGGAAADGGLGAAGHHHAIGLDPLTLAALSGHGPLGFGAPHQAHAAAAAAAITGGQAGAQAAHHLAGFAHAGHNGTAGGHAARGHHHPHNANPLTAAALVASQQALLGFGTVLLVSNIAEQLATPDALFTLFGVYGDVMRVKVLFNKKDNALIQMAEPQQASLALNYLDKLKLFGKAMRVMSSKHGLVQLPKEGQPDSGLTKDFSNSPLHRFKKPGSKNYSNIYPPSATLHLSNIPQSTTEENIREAFANNLPPSCIVQGFKFFPKDRKMALIQLPSIEDAVYALVKMHNYQLGESAHLRVSFSKSSI